MDPEEVRAIGQRTVHPKRLPETSTARWGAPFSQTLVGLLLASGACVACGDDFPRVPAPEDVSGSATDDVAQPTNEPAPEVSEPTAPEPVAVTQTNTLTSTVPPAEVKPEPEPTEAEEVNTPAEPMDGAGLGDIIDQMSSAQTTETPAPEPAPSATETEPAETAPAEPEPPDEVTETEPEPEPPSEPEPEFPTEPEPEPEPEVPADPIVVPPVAAGNLLTNPGFEAGTTDWEPWGGQLAVSDTAHTGDSSGRASSRTDTWNGVLRDILALVEAGETYEASAWATTSSSGQTLGLTVKTVCGATEEYINLASGTGTVGTWTELHGTFTVPTCSLQSLSLYVEGPSAGTDLFVDDMSLSAE